MSEPIPAIDLKNQIQAKAVDHGLTQEATLRASAEPLPADVRDIWLGRDEVAVGGVKIRKPKPGDMLILEEIESPMVKLYLEFQKKPELREMPRFGPVDRLEMIYQFSRPAMDSWNVLVEPEGRKKFKLAAIEFGQPLEMGVISQCFDLIWEQFVESPKAKVEFSGDDEKKTE